MNPKRYARITEVFQEAIALSPQDREAYLDDACAGDAELRSNVDAMLQCDDQLEPTIGIEAGEAIEAMHVAIANDFTQQEEDGLPRRIGSYRPVRIIGRGGMGIVYEAEQDSPRRTVALKMIHSHVISPSQLRRFKLEAELLGRLQHPGIAKIYEAGTVKVGPNELPFFAMELIDGCSITKHISQNSLDTNGILRLFAPICEAVQHAHQKGVVHRDLKPDNILVNEAGQPRILDFGVARSTDADIKVTTVQTNEGALVGTVPYMSPEQVKGRVEDVDIRSDVYSLGVLLFELLTGRLPHDLRGRSLVEAARMINEDEPTRLGSVSSQFRNDLDVIVGKALEKDPARRYQSAGELGTDIQRYLKSEPISARPPSAFYISRRFARRHRGLVIGIATTMLALAIGLVAALNFALQSKANESQALWTSYCSQMARASSAFQEGEFVVAGQALEATDPQWRGWEYNYLNSRLRPEILSRSPSDGFRWIGNYWPEDAGPRALIRSDKLIRAIDVRSNDVLWEYNADEISKRRIRWTGSRLVSPAGEFVEVIDPILDRKLKFSYPFQGRWSRHQKYFSVDREAKRLACFLETNDGPQVVVMDLDTGAAVFRYPIRLQSHPQAISLSPSGSKIMITVNTNSPGFKGEIRILEVPSGKSCGFAMVHAGGVRWSDDESKLAVYCPVRRVLQLVSLTPPTSGSVIKFPQSRERRHVPFFSRTGSYIASCAQYSTEIWRRKIKNWSQDSSGQPVR